MLLRRGGPRKGAQTGGLSTIESMNTASWTLELPLLETSRLRLRKLAIEDAADIFAYASDPEVTRYLRFSEHKSMADSRAFLLRTLQSYRSGADLLWGIELKSAGRIIG